MLVLSALAVARTRSDHHTLSIRQTPDWFECCYFPDRLMKTQSCIMLHRDTRSSHLMGQTMLWYKWYYLADELIKLQSGIIGTDSIVTGTSVVTIPLVARQACEDRLAQWQLINQVITPYGSDSIVMVQMLLLCCHLPDKLMKTQTCPMTTDTRSSHLTGQTVLWWYKWCYWQASSWRHRFPSAGSRDNTGHFIVWVKNSIVPGMTRVWVVFINQQADQGIFTE